MKRTLYIVSVIIVSLLLVGGMLVAVLHNAGVQTALVRVVTAELSRGLQTKTTVGKVEYRFPARLLVEDLYLEDQQGDTLLYAGTLYARMSPMALRRNCLRFSTVEIDRVRAYVHQLPDSTYNYEFLVRAFASDDTTSTPLPIDIQADNIRLSDVMVRYDDYTARLDETRLSLDKLSQEEVQAAVHNLRGEAWKGKERLSVEDVQVQFVLNDSLCAMPTLYVRLPRTEVDLSGVRLEQKKHLQLKINQAHLIPGDIALFVPQVRDMESVIDLSGEVSGSIDSLQARELSVSLNNRRLLYGDVTAYGLPEWRKMYVRAELKDLLVNAPMLQDVISDYLNKPYRLPREVWRLGDMHYHGKLEGDPADLHLKGALRTAMGTITTDAVVSFDSLSPNIPFRGTIATRHFRLGKLLAVPDLGDVSLRVSGKGELREDGPYAHIQATVSDFTYCEYTYRNICLNGNITRQSYDGELTIDDENVQVHFTGLADFDKQAAEMDFALSLDHFRPGALNLSEKYSDTEVGLRLRAHSVGLHVDQLNGYLIIDSLQLRNGRDSLMMQELELVMQSDGPYKSLRLISDFLTCRVQGDFNYVSLPTTMQKFAIQYLPDLFDEQTRKRILRAPSNNQVDFYLYGHQLWHLQRLLDLPIVVSDYPVLKGFINESEQLWGVHGYVPYLSNRKERIREITLEANNNDNQANVNLSTRWYNSQYTLHTTAQDNTVGIDFTGLDSLQQQSGNVKIDVGIRQHKNLPDIAVHIHPSTLHFADSLFHFSDSRIHYCVADTLLQVDHFRLYTEAMFVDADGVGSTHATDSLKVQLSRIRLGYILPFVVPEETIFADGKLSGWATLYGLFSKPVFEADVRLDSAYLNEDHIGDAIAKVELDRETNHIVIDADVVTPTRRVAHLDGLVEPEKDKWELDIYPDSISIAFINHWTSDILHNIGGTASGIVQVLGDGPITYVLAKVKAHEAHLTIPYTGCTYYVNDSVFMDSTAIRFPNLKMHDEEGNPLYINGVLSHFNFKNFKFKIDGELKHTMAINLPNKAGEWVQGKVYADGDVHIVGDDDAVVLSANAKSVGKSRFRMSVAGASTAAENEFITFTDHNKILQEEADERENHDFIEKKVLKHGPKTKFRMGMNIDINPELLFQLVINDRTGDMLQGRGDGALRFTMDDSSGEMRLLGTYTLLHGTFGFTVGNLVRRDFTIAEGSQVIWNGKPEEPVLNATAKYRVTASLKDLFGDQISSLPTTRTSVPVNTCLNISGGMDNPVLRFSLELPQSDQAIESQVRSMINTDEMMMRQVVYLLVFGRFFTPEYMRSTAYAPTNETYSLLSSTVTGQINSWLGKLTNVFTLGFNFRSDGNSATDANATQEYEAVFQLQPVDRLLINGNVGYRYNDISNRPIFGDLDVEYMITPNGKVRIRAYTHTVDKYSLRQADMQQGVGFVFKHDFNWKKDK